MPALILQAFLHSDGLCLLCQTLNKETKQFVQKFLPRGHGDQEVLASVRITPGWRQYAVTPEPVQWQDGNNLNEHSGV